MSYDQLAASHALLRLSNAHDTAENLAATPAVYGGYAVVYPIIVRRIYFYMTVTALSSSVNAVVCAKQRPSFNSTSGEVTLGTITIPSGTASGSVLYKDVSAVRLNPGDELSYEHLTQQTSTGTAAGAGFYGVLYELAPEYIANSTDLIASA